MELIRAVMLNIIVLVFFATVLDLLLPDGSFRSDIKMAMGFFAVLTMLHPVVQILQIDYSASVAQHLTLDEQSVMTSLPTGNMTQEPQSDITRQYTLQAETQYAEQTAKQAAALLQLSDYTVENVQCYFVEAKDVPNQRQMMLHIQLVQGDQHQQSNIRTAISGYFGLDLSQVQVEVIEEADNVDRKADKRTD